MNRFTRLLIILAMFPVYIVQAQTFNAECATGQLLKYRVLTSDPTAVALIGYDGIIAGPISLPSSVAYGGKEYTVKEIRDHAFFHCSNLTGSLVIPNNVTSLGSYAFCYCCGFDSLILNDELTSIGKYAFVQCSGFTGALDIPDNVTIIGENAFQGCSSLNEITIGEKVRSIKKCTFQDCASLTKLTNNATACLEIGENAFYGCHHLSDTIVLTNSVISIGQRAFGYCKALKHIVIGNELTTIHDYTFEQCEGLTGNFIIPDKVTSIGKNAFNGCSSLTEITIGEKVTAIGEGAFQHCEGLTGKLSIPDKVTVIGKQAFQGCSGLTEITIGENVSTIGEEAFQHCEGLRGKLSIPDKVTTIGKNAFNGCSGLIEITIGSSVNAIKEGAFQDCHNLSKVIYNAKKCNEIVFDDDEGISIFHGCDSLQKLVIGSSVTAIPANAFRFCDALSDTLSIPYNITTIGKKAFEGCSGFSAVFVTASNPPTVGDSAFVNFNPETPLFVLCEKREAYQQATGWNVFDTIHEGIIYSINLSTDEEMGSVSIIDRPIDCGDTKKAKVEATAHDHYRFKNWKINGEDKPNDTIPIYSFTLDKDYDLVAIFKPKKVRIVVNIEPEIGGTVPPLTSVYYKDNVELTAISDPCYHFIGWRYNDEIVSTEETYYFEAIEEDYTFTAVFEANPISITTLVESAEFGSVTGTDVYPCGDRITVSAMANEGYRFVTWRENGNDISNLENYSFIPTRDRVLVAIFEIFTYQIEAFAFPLYAGEVTGSGKYLPNESVTLTATGREGSNFVCWAENGNIISTESSITIVADSDKKYQAWFEFTGVDENQAGFDIYPNPNTGLVNIKGSDIQEIKIFNVLGLMVNNVTHIDKEEIQLDLTHCASGIYTILIVTQDKSFSRKIIKE